MTSSRSPDNSPAQAGGLLNAVRQAGAMLGVAVMGGVAGPAAAMVLAAVVCAAAEIWCAAAPQR
ncbi:hypothetical protein ABZW11_08020 [Nonomuraea sp. NPDC004580]|uniref:hypothetical protein n=1 Tax=Nonomuraea sp. NPDC004580 TaxID=3154552 RepID=UPI0033A7846B